MPPKRKATAEATSAPPTKKATAVKSKKSTGRNTRSKKAPVDEDVMIVVDSDDAMCNGVANSNVATPANLLRKYESQDVNGTSRGTIGAEGTEALFTDMGISLEGLEPMILAWRTKAPELGTFEIDAIVHFMDSYGISSLDKLKAHLIDTNSSLKVERSQSFKPFYTFLFPFFLANGARSLPIDIAITLWGLMLPLYAEADPQLVNAFLTFLEERMKAVLKGITKDVWGMVLECVENMKLETMDGKTVLVGWSEDGAWPTLIDQFAESFD